MIITATITTMDNKDNGINDIDTKSFILQVMDTLSTFRWLEQIWWMVIILQNKEIRKTFQCETPMVSMIFTHTITCLFIMLGWAAVGMIFRLMSSFVKYLSSLVSSDWNKMSDDLSSFTIEKYLNSKFRRLRKSQNFWLAVMLSN